MREEIQKKINLLFSSGLSTSRLVRAIEIEIAKLIPYDHSKPETFDACNIDAQHIGLAIEGRSSASSIIENIESQLSKRELSFVLFNQLTSEIDSRVSKTSSDRDFKDYIKKLSSNE